LEQLGAVKHSRDLHVVLPYLWFDSEQNLGVRTGSSRIVNRIHLKLSSWSTYRNGSQPSDYLLVT
jgi:hypothetical protein